VHPPGGPCPDTSRDLISLPTILSAATVQSREREARLKELFAAGWTTELFAEFWAATDLNWIPSIITDDVVGYWPGGRTVHGRAAYMQALEELLALLPDLRLEVPEHTMSAEGEFGFSR
jgi:ketosteroid isomerase-like protein